MSTLAVLTSIYGHLDELEDPPPMDGVDEYVAVVDRDHGQRSRWRQVIEPRPHLSDRMASKIAKCHPHRYTNADVVVWIDGYARVRDDAARWVADGLSQAHPISQFVHPERDDLSAEADVSVSLRKYGGLPLVEQAASYRKQGMPDGWGLWATGVMGRYRCPRSETFGTWWLAEQIRWSPQDQVSEPFVLWELGIRPVELEGSLWHDPHVRFVGHASDL